ncbi:MAG: hypothetical protein ACFFFG_18285 [Candidatus Thorarchaeota archaeon]
MPHPTKMDITVTFIGIFQCCTLLLPLGFYKIEPPPSGVGILWGFLVAPTYFSLLAGLLLIFRHQLLTYFQVKTDLILIVSGLLTSILTFFLDALLFPLTRMLIGGFHLTVTHLAPITYLDVESGGIFKYVSLALGFLCLILGGYQYLNRETESNADGFF